jgi:hypothetical protein
LELLGLRIIGVIRAIWVGLLGLSRFSGFRVIRVIKVVMVTVINSHFVYPYGS